MCTVTLIPTGENNFILTSNRDEVINRKTLLPEFYPHGPWKHPGTTDH